MLMTCQMWKRWYQLPWNCWHELLKTAAAAEACLVQSMSAVRQGCFQSVLCKLCKCTPVDCTADCTCSGTTEVCLGHLGVLWSTNWLTHCTPPSRDTGTGGKPPTRLASTYPRLRCISMPVHHSLLMLWLATARLLICANTASAMWFVRPSLFSMLSASPRPVCACLAVPCHTNSDDTNCRSASILLPRLQCCACNVTQVRALLYTSTLTNAIMEAMAAVETAVMEALAHQTTLYPRPTPATFDDYHLQLARASQPVHEALTLSGFSGKQWVQESQTGTQSWLYTCALTGLNYMCVGIKQVVCIHQMHSLYGS